MTRRRDRYRRVRRALRAWERLVYLGGTVNEADRTYRRMVTRGEGFSRASRGVLTGYRAAYLFGIDVRGYARRQRNHVRRVNRRRERRRGQIHRTHKVTRLDLGVIARLAL